MFWDADNERDERKQRFIALMKDRKSRELLGPLSEKLLAYDQDETGPEEVFRAALHAGRRGEALIGDFKKRPDVILAGIAMDENRYLTAIGDIGVSVRLAKVTGVFSDAVVVPAAEGGAMDSGAALTVREEGGSEVEEELKSSLPEAGTLAVATGPGALTAAKVIHVFVPADGSDEDITAGVGAALALADELGCETAALPGFYAGGAAADKQEAAAAVIRAVEGLEAESLSKVVLCDEDEEVVDAWVELLEQLDEE